MPQLTLGLSTEEMACRCCGALVCDPRLLKAYGAFRAKLARPLQIVSGYRCRKHNAEVGGEPDSQHCRGKALDIACDAVDLESDWIYHQLIAAGFRGIGHGGGIFHIDVREAPYGWRYTPDGIEVDTDLLHLLQGAKS